mmetsp:Transcript_91978/g.168646  ORF Transcript_91978/g.168646 Transcript_91978/m.168646 type:complete len:209 (+) Transcript_91978:804-1430(+)
MQPRQQYLVTIRRETCISDRKPLKMMLGYPGIVLAIYGKDAQGLIQASSQHQFRVRVKMQGVHHRRFSVSHGICNLHRLSPDYVNLGRQQSMSTPQSRSCGHGARRQLLRVLALLFGGALGIGSFRSRLRPACSAVHLDKMLSQPFLVLVSGHLHLFVSLPQLLSSIMLGEVHLQRRIVTVDPSRFRLSSGLALLALALVALSWSLCG